MSENINNEITQISKSISDLAVKIESGYATKNDLQKHADAVQALSKNMNSIRVLEKTHPLFGSYGQAHQFVGLLQKSVEESGYQFSNGKPKWISEKADLNSYGSGTGVDFVPTETSDLFSVLLSQGGIARQVATVYSGLQGNLVLTKRNGTSTAAFTAAGGTLKDDVAVTPVAPGEAKVTLSPQQVAALALVSEKLLYQSAVNVAEIVAADMIEQAGVLEDNCVIKGDGTNTYGNITGIQGDASVNEELVAYASWTNLDNVFALTGVVAEAAFQADDAAFYMSKSGWAKIRQFKPTNNTYYFDPVSGLFNIAGFPVRMWHRMDTPGSQKFPVFFGSMKKAVYIGTGRDYSIVVDRSYKFNTVQAAFRLAYDFDAKILEPTALARLKTTS